MDTRRLLFLSLVSLFFTHAFATRGSKTFLKSDGDVKSVTFRSPPFTLAPGEVQNAFYYGASFVKGHIGIKGFDAEVVDEDGNSVPLNEVYLHHWVVVNYYNGPTIGYDRSTVIGNDGVCPKNALSQLFGLGSETRHTSTHIPGPYAIEAGVYDEEAWLLNVHAIDTRGTVDPFGCLECRCDLYNVTIDEYGRPVKDDYRGGLLCCYDGTRCQLNDGYVGENRTYYLQYTVHYTDWHDSIFPVKVYILDVTYEGSRCKIEYDVPSCAADDIGAAGCMHTQKSAMTIPVGGEVIYAVAHQHSGGVGATIYGKLAFFFGFKTNEVEIMLSMPLKQHVTFVWKDGREICTSTPLYGNGTEVGNEDGYIVGMTTCYPEPGTVRVSSGESLLVVSNYSESTSHTGVMGLAYIVVDPQAEIKTA